MILENLQSFTIYLYIGQYQKKGLITSWIDMTKHVQN